MPDDPLNLPVLRRPTAQRPLLGLTILAVDDSRFASEALRLLCLRSGARLRRADSIGAARRHLSLYRPTVVIVDLGLPDGNGLDLIAELDAAVPRVPAILATSGDPDGASPAMAAGAQAFLSKPVSDLAVFQQVILSVLPEEMRPRGLRAVSGDRVEPDVLALRDDLNVVARVLDESTDDNAVAYAAQFLSSLAQSTKDAALGAAARGLTAGGDAARRDAAIAHAMGLVTARLRNAAPI